MEWNDQTQTLQVRKKSIRKIWSPDSAQVTSKIIWTKSESGGMFSLLGWAWLEAENEYFGMEGHLKCTKPNH